MNTLLTGMRQVGKTSVCEAVVQLARAGGWTVGGVLCPAVMGEEGTKLGFQALDVATDQRWLLADTEQALEGPSVGPYSFDADGLAKALAVLREAAAAPPDLLFVDEIGPLELQSGEGFAPILDELPLDGPGHVLVVVRPSLLPALRRRLGRIDFSIYTVTEDNRAILPEIIVREFWLRD